MSRPDPSLVHDDQNILFDHDDTGAIGNCYTHGMGVDEHLAVASGGKERYYYHADGLGSVMALTDSMGKVVQTSEYDSFGTLKDQKNRVKQLYAYTGREWDKETGLYYYRARYYDPMEGRFISKDPIGFKGGLNLYGYAQNNPINLEDPSGLDPLGPNGNINPVTQCHVQPTKKQLADLVTLSALLGITSVVAEDVLLYSLTNPQQTLDFIQSALPSTTPEPNGAGFLGSQFGSKLQYYLENRK